jgi:hypothetical protein
MNKLHIWLLKRIFKKAVRVRILSPVMLRYSYETNLITILRLLRQTLIDEFTEARYNEIDTFLKSAFDESLLDPKHSLADYNCKGLKHCLNRNYDENEKDCVECWADDFVTQALTED